MSCAIYFFNTLPYNYTWNNSVIVLSYVVLASLAKSVVQFQKNWTLFFAFQEYYFGVVITKEDMF